MLSLKNGLVAASRCTKAAIRSKHSLPPLPYPYNALEPVLSCEIMELHHQKHHQAYVNNLNAAEEKLKEAIQKNNTAGVIALMPALKFNGGGHINHTIFWNNLDPKGGGAPSGELLEAICSKFGGFDKFKKELMEKTNAIQGSGWGWLGYNKQTKRLEVATTANQDPLITKGLVPLLAIDVWEHAYYLQYKNVRADYTKKIFDVINWNDVAKRLGQAKCEP